MKKLLYLVAFFFTGYSSLAQDVGSTLAKYAEQYTAERVYLHYDKSSYLPGDTVWFKVYMMKAVTPSEDTKTLYIDWTDEDGRLWLHGSCPVENGTSFGQFAIPATFPGRFLHVRAYTKWMLNFDTAFLYNKDIRILSHTANNEARTKITPELTFFPEGGDAVYGLTSKIALKANDQYGRPVKVKGEIKNRAGVSVATFKSIHDGMGYFYLNPHEGEVYTAYWQDEAGNKHTTVLDHIRDKGISLQVSIAGTKRNFMVKVSPESPELKKLHVIGTMYQQKVFDFEKEVTDGTIEGVIPAEDLPSGILTITVFDEAWKPLAERITYINNNEYRFAPSMTVAHWGLNKRARNEIELSIPDSLTADLSISVTDLAIDADSSDDIISHLLLTGELKGKINNPSYYFSGDADSISQHLDLVMLTHGWRRFDWEKITKGELPDIRYRPDTAYLSISGKVFGATPTQLREAGQIVLIISQAGEGPQIFPVPLRSDGSFSDPGLILFDTAKIYYQIGKKNKSIDATVQFMQDKLPPFSANAGASHLFLNSLSDTTGNSYHFKLSDALLSELKLSQAKVLQTVSIQAKPKSTVQEMDKKYTSGLFSGGDGYQFDVLNDKFAVGSQDIFQYLQGKVAGLTINTATRPPTLSWRGGTPDLFLNEMSLDADGISSVPVSDVAYIKVFRPPFMGAPGGGSGGAIAIYTRKGGDVQEEPGKGLSNNVVNGYSAIRQFYSPDYESLDAARETKDLRTTLYWNPSIQLAPGANKVILKFFNNDVTNAFRVVIEGMTKDGRLAHVVQVME